MAFPLVTQPADWQNEIHTLNMGGTPYSIRDRWAWAELEALEAIVSSPLNFGGISTTPIADGDSVKELNKKGGGTIPTSAQTDGTIILYEPQNKVEKTQEFIVQGGKYWEFGSTGLLKGFAYVDKGQGTYTDTQYSINGVTVVTNLGTLGVTTTEGSKQVETATASLTDAKTESTAVSGPSVSFDFTALTGGGTATGATITLANIVTTQTKTLATSTADIPNLTLTSTNTGGVEATKITDISSSSIQLKTYSLSTGGTSVTTLDGGNVTITANARVTNTTYELVADVSVIESSVAHAQTITLAEKAANVTTTNSTFTAYTTHSYASGVLTISSSTSDAFLKTVAVTIPQATAAIAGTDMEIPVKKLSATNTGVNVAGAQTPTLSTVQTIIPALSESTQDVTVVNSITKTLVTAPKYSLEAGDPTKITYAPGGSSITLTGGNVTFVPKVTLPAGTTVTPSVLVGDISLPEITVSGHYQKATSVTVIDDISLMGSLGSALVTPMLTATTVSKLVTVDPVPTGI